MAKIWFILWMYFFCIGPILVTKVNTESISDTLAFIKKLQNKLSVTKNGTIILMVGMMGSGKSTTVRFVASDHSEIKSIEPNSMEFSVRDELDPKLDKTNLPQASRTIIPEKMVDENGNVFYDLPEFADTQNITIEIATTFLIKSLVEQAATIKFVLIVSHESATEDYSRNDFNELLSCMTKLIKNTDRFKNSVSLVVSEVESVKISHRQSVDVSEDSVKNTAAQFLKDHRAFLQKQGKHEEKINLIDGLLKQDENNSYPRISILWRLSNSGLFDTIPKMISARQLIRESIINHTSYADIQANDFGFALSAEAKMHVHKIAEHTIDYISTILRNVSDELLVKVYEQINSIGSLNKRLTLIMSGKHCIEITQNAITLKQLTQQIKQLIYTFNVTTIDMNELNRIEQHEANLNIIKSLMETETITNSTTKSVQVNLNYHQFLDKIFELFAKSEIEIRNTIEHEVRIIIENISSILKEIDGQIFIAIQSQLDLANGFGNKLEILERAQNCIESSSRENLTLKKHTEEFLNLIRTFDIESIQMSKIYSLKQYEKHLNALSSDGHMEIVTPNNWISSSYNSVKNLTEQYRWNLFLSETYQFLTGYEVQRNVDAYDVAQLSHWGELNRPKGLIISKNNFNEFTKRIKHDSNFNYTPSRQRDLNEILDTTIKSKTKYQCDQEKNTMTIEGIFVKSSDIRLSMCPMVELAHIRVFVVDTFYVDSDLYLNKTNEVTLYIFAHKWHVLQGATFFLNGIDGKSHPRLESKGTAGKQGNQGTNAGLFTGVANKAINLDLLTVELNGGRGGDGQDGTSSDDNYVNFNETFYTEPYSRYHFFTTPSNYLNAQLRRYFTEKVHDAELQETNSSYLQTSSSELIAFTSFTLHSQKCCGKTGVGGDGGRGGARGKFSFFQTGGNASISPRSSTIDGTNGKPGQNGHFCTSSDLEVDVKSKLIISWFGYSLESRFETRRVENSKCFNGYTPTTASSDEKSTFSKQTPASLTSVFSMNLVEYKTFLIKHVKISSLVTKVQKSYDILSSNAEITPKSHFFDVIVHEALALDKLYFELDKFIDMLPLYENLLARVESHIKDLSSNSEEWKGFSLLCATLLSKTELMQCPHKSDLIVDIDNFLQLTIQNIEELDEMGRISAVNEQSEKYKEDILLKINEAHDYIDGDIKPEIKQLFTMLNDEIRRTVDETVALQSKTSEDIQRKKENAVIIRRNASIRKMMGAIRTVAEFISIVYRNAIGLLVEFGANYLKDEIEDGLDNPDIINSEVPLAIENLRKKFRLNNQEKMKAIEVEFDKLIDSVKRTDFINEDFDGELNDLLSKVNATKSKLSPQHSEIIYLLNKCFDFSNGWQHRLIVMRTTGAKEVSQSLQKLSHALAVIASWNDQDFDHVKLDEIGRAIIEDRETLVALMRFEDMVYVELIPLVDHLQNYWQNLKENLADKSSTALSVLQSRVRNSFRVVQRQLRDVISQFETERRANDCLIRINEAIDLMINIYDRIQSYHEKIKFATFLSHIQTANAQTQNIAPFQNDLINKLQFNLQANIVLYQYTRGINAFKQAIFPFAAKYLRMYNVPAAITANNKLVDVVTFAANNVKSLRMKIVEFNKTVINDNDQLIHVADFNNERRTGSKGPFYIWRNSEIRDKIEQLFEGKKIYLLADVSKSDARNAVKFNKIGLKFRCNNQTEFNDIIQDIHLNLTHTGESNYRCNKDFYTISGPPIIIEFSFAERNHMPTDRNAIYNKLYNSAQMLSPYTVWSIQLTYGPIEKLKPFAGLVDIELQGSGQYVTENVKICKTNLQKYYSLKPNLAN